MKIETVASNGMTAVGNVDSPVGKLRIAADASGLREIRFLRDRDSQPSEDRNATKPLRSSDDRAGDEPSRDRSVANSASEAERIVTETVEQLSQYFDGKRRVFDLRLAPRGTAFQQRVWNALLSIPFGQLVSYGEIAHRIGLPRASRAVGAANGANPIPIVIPCHRVIGSSGTLTGYGGGLDIKEKLLLLEGIGIDGQGSRAARVASHQVSLPLRTSDSVALK